jgi:25S rRNA (uracil2634-N3)-methyltransferase
LKAKQKLSQAAQVLQQKAKRNNNNSKGGAQQNVASGSGISQVKGKGKEKATSTAQPSTAKPIIPFKPTDKILLIGEGNFSFARALVIDSPPEITHMPPSNITATTYDSEEDCYSKYTDAQEIVEGLRDKGVKVLFGVDGTRLDRAAGIKGKKFDRIVFNFPHAGASCPSSRPSLPRKLISNVWNCLLTGKGISDQDRNILSNQMLILGFLSSASRFLVPGPIPVAFQSRKRKRSDDEEESGDDGGSEDEDAMDLSGSSSALARGTVLITLRNVVPYTQW